MSDENQASVTPLDVVVGAHHFHRSEHGMVRHHVDGQADHSVGGLRSSLEAFAEEITRLRALVPPEQRGDTEPPPVTDPMGSNPDAPRKGRS